MNNFSLVGRTTSDIELRTTQNNKSVVSFSIAVPKQFNRKETSFFECKAWDKTAELLSSYVHKGQQVGLSGYMEQERYTVEGSNRSKIVFVVQDITFIVNGEKSFQKPSQEKANIDFEVLPDSTDGLPF